MARLRRIYRIVESDGSSGPVSLDIELFIRLLEWAHEEAGGDVEIHRLTENVEALVSECGTLTMDDYGKIIASVAGSEVDSEEPPQED